MELGRLGSLGADVEPGRRAWRAVGLGAGVVAPGARCRGQGARRGERRGGAGCLGLAPGGVPGHGLLCTREGEARGEKRESRGGRENVRERREGEKENRGGGGLVLGELGACRGDRV